MAQQCTLCYLVKKVQSRTAILCYIRYHSFVYERKKVMKSRKWTRKILVVFLSIAIMVTFTPATAFIYAAEADGQTVTTDEGTTTSTTDEGTTTLPEKATDEMEADEPAADAAASATKDSANP